MQNLVLCAAILTSSLAMAQMPAGLSSQQWTSGVVGVAAGQTARLNVMYPSVPAPLLQVTCSATLAIADDQGTILKSKDFSLLSGGKSVSLDLEGDLPGVMRTQVHGLTTTPGGCHLVATLEIFDNATQKTVVVVGSELTWPLARLFPGGIRPVGPLADRP